MIGSQPLRVLVVDDEPGMRETLEDILEAVGYDVRTAIDGDDALSVLHSQQLDVVVMDIQMPKLDGVSVLQAMGPPPPAVIVMTAYAVEERLHSAVNSQAFAVLHKPFPVRRLLRLVLAAAGEGTA